MLFQIAGLFTDLTQPSHHHNRFAISHFSALTVAALAGGAPVIGNTTRPWLASRCSKRGRSVGHVSALKTDRKYHECKEYGWER